VAALLVALGSGWFLAGRAATVRAGTRGAELYHGGQIGRAYPLLQQAVRDNRLQAKPCVDLGDLAVWAIDDGAFQHFYRIDSGWTLARLAFLSYAEALKRQPGAPRAWAGMAELFKKARILGIKDDAVDLDLLDQGAGQAYEEEDRLVVEAYRKALFFEPNNYFYHAYLGDFFDERGFREEALEAYAKAVEIMPDLSWHYYLPERDLPRDMYDRVSVALARALETNPTFPRDRIMQNMGDLAERGGEREAALQHYRDAASIAQDPSVYLYLLGNLYFNMKRYEEAEKTLEEAIERESLQPRMLAISHTLIGRCAMLREDVEAALEHLERARWHNPSAYYIAVDLGRAHEKMGEMDKAEVEYRSAIRLAPDRAGVYSPLINMYRRTRQLSKAIPLAERLVELFPDNQVFRAQVESLYRELGRPDAG
jgi:tetratricopeptide (TPR) repeat protein